MGDSRIGAKQPPQAFRIAQVRFGAPEFDAILSLRRLAYGRAEAGVADPVDEYSYHLVALPGDAETDSPQCMNLLLGACRLTLRKHGTLESEDFYPKWLLDEFADLIGAGSRMCVRPDLKSSKLAERLLAGAWSLALTQGGRIDVSKARLKAIPYYLKMGYFFVRGSAFPFHRWDTHCGLIALPANAAHQSRMSDTFAGLENPCPLSAFSPESRFTRSLNEFREDVRRLDLASRQLAHSAWLGE